MAASSAHNDSYANDAYSLYASEGQPPLDPLNPPNLPNLIYSDHSNQNNVKSIRSKPLTLRQKFDDLKDLVKQQQHRLAIQKYSGTNGGNKACWHYYMGKAYFACGFHEEAYDAWTTAYFVAPIPRTIRYQIAYQKLIPISASARNADPNLPHYIIREQSFLIEVVNRRDNVQDDIPALCPFRTALDIKINRNIFHGTRLDQNTLSYRDQAKTNYIDINNLGSAIQSISFETTNEHYGDDPITPKINNTKINPNRYSVIVKNRFGILDSDESMSLMRDFMLLMNNIQDYEIENMRDAVNTNDINRIHDCLNKYIQPGAQYDIRQINGELKVRLFVVFKCINNNCNGHTWASNKVTRYVPNNFDPNQLGNTIKLTHLHRAQDCKYCKTPGQAEYYELFDRNNPVMRIGGIHQAALCVKCRLGICHFKRKAYNCDKFGLVLKMFKKINPQKLISHKNIEGRSIIYVA